MLMLLFSWEEQSCACACVNWISCCSSLSNIILLGPWMQWPAHFCLHSVVAWVLPWLSRQRRYWWLGLDAVTLFVQSSALLY